MRCLRIGLIWDVEACCGGGCSEKSCRSGHLTPRTIVCSVPASDAVPVRQPVRKALLRQATGGTRKSIFGSANAPSAASARMPVRLRCSNWYRTYRGRRLRPSAMHASPGRESFARAAVTPARPALSFLQSDGADRPGRRWTQRPALDAARAFHPVRRVL